MSKKSNNSKKIDLSEKIKDEPQLVNVQKTPVLATLRQFFYINKQFNENLISTLERTYKDEIKTEDEWIDICIAKKIIFK